MCDTSKALYNLTQHKSRAEAPPGGSLKRVTSTGDAVARSDLVLDPRGLFCGLLPLELGPFLEQVPLQVPPPPGMGRHRGSTTGAAPAPLHCCHPTTFHTHEISQDIKGFPPKCRSYEDMGDRPKGQVTEPGKGGDRYVIESRLGLGLDKLQGVHFGAV